jgi:hypothetical protein
VADEKFDEKMLSDHVAVGAIWLLYKWGRWGALEDIGLEREKVEPLFKQFEATNVTNTKPGKQPLTKKQAQALEKLVPGLTEARIELQLAYMLKLVDEGASLENLSRRGRRQDEQAAE